MIYRYEISWWGSEMNGPMNLKMDHHTAIVETEEYKSISELRKALDEEGFEDVKVKAML